MIRRARRPGPSVRLKLTLSYAGFLVVAGALLLAVVWVFLLRYVPAGNLSGPGPFVPNRGDLERAFAPAAIWAMVFIVVFGVVGGWFLAGRMLAPLERLTEATRRAAGGSLSHRVGLPGRQDEFRELADSFDDMLDRLEAHVDEQRRFAANASHELRTPLAITRTLLDVARDDPGRDPAALVERLRIVNERAIALTEALLLLSRAEQRSFAREPVDLSLLVEEAMETLLPLAELRGVTMRSAGDVTVALGSPDLLRQLVMNLVHNAIVHNVPEGGTLDVSVAARPGAAVLEVENSGSRLAPHVVSTLSEPFQRGNERIRDDHHAGVGLGLAIARTIVVAHDGTIALTAGAEGGLKATVTLPAVPDGARPAAPSAG